MLPQEPFLVHVAELDTVDFAPVAVRETDVVVLDSAAPSFHYLKPRRHAVRPASGEAGNVSFGRLSPPFLPQLVRHRFLVVIVTYFFYFDMRAAALAHYLTPYVRCREF